jgi:hypothetical protein
MLGASGRQGIDRVPVAAADLGLSLGLATESLWLGPFVSGAGDENRTRVASLEVRPIARSDVVSTPETRPRHTPRVTAIDHRLGHVEGTQSEREPATHESERPACRV